ARRSGDRSRAAVVKRCVLAMASLPMLSPDIIGQDLPRATGGAMVWRSWGRGGIRETKRALSRTIGRLLAGFRVRRVRGYGRGRRREMRIQLGSARDLRVAVGLLTDRAQGVAEVVVRGRVVRLHRDNVAVHVDRLARIATRCAQRSEER